MSGARRPGPRVDVDVPTLLVSIAERMFAREGIDAVSLRAVARAAGVAPAAVTYHFASKQALVAEVIDTRNKTAGAEVRARLTQLLESSDEIGIRDLVEAVLQPMVALIESDPVGGLDWMKIFSRLALVDDPVFHHAMEMEPNLNSLFDRASRQAIRVPYTPEVGRRVGLAMYAMINALAGADLVGYGSPLGDDGVLDPQFVEQLILFTAAGITLGE